MDSRIPADVLLLVCEELGNKQDFGTLFNCALSSRGLVGPALSWLYRVHNQSKFFSNESADAELSKPQYQFFLAWRNQQIRTVSKWALLWKSIIRSSIGKTAYPYALYIRALDLRNLTYLFEDQLFRKNAMDDFFADDMAPFLEAQETPNQKRTRGGKAVAMRLNIPVVLSLVGESITNFVSVAATENDATVALDEIAPGDISSAVLPSWTGRLSRLKTMTLWDGVVLNEDLANAINHHCPNFKDLTFYRCSRDGTDPDFAAFFGALRSNSLESFTALNAQGIGQKTLLALNNHSSSLKVLHLDGLWCDAIKNLSLLQGCLALESLFIKDAHGNIDLEATENDVFLEVVDWLGRCERLRELTFEKLVSAPTILTHLCLNNDTRLRKLKVTGYSLTGSQDFHKALSHQTTLQSLTLTAEAEGSFRDDIDTLVSSVCQLKALTHLDLCDASDYFRNPEISRIATSLKRLETFTFSGYDVTDAVWYAISGLHSLRVLAIQALTSFTVDGVLGYISTLQPTNQGLVLSLWKQNGESDFSENDKSIIQESIADKVEGRFEFELFRGDSDYSVDSDW